MHYKADVNYVNKSGFSTLFNVDEKYRQFLLDNKADVNIGVSPSNGLPNLIGFPGEYGDNQDYRNCIFFLKNDGNVNIRDEKTGNTALIEWMKDPTLNTKYFELVLQYGANPLLKNKEGKTALDISKETIKKYKAIENLENNIKIVEYYGDFYKKAQDYIKLTPDEKQIYTDFFQLLKLYTLEYDDIKPIIYPFIATDPTNLSKFYDEKLTKTKVYNKEEKKYVDVDFKNITLKKKYEPKKNETMSYEFKGDAQELFDSMKLLVTGEKQVEINELIGYLGTFNQTFDALESSGIFEYSFEGKNVKQLRESCIKSAKKLDLLFGDTDNLLNEYANKFIKSELYVELKNLNSLRKNIRNKFCSLKI